MKLPKRHNCIICAALFLAALGLLLAAARAPRALSSQTEAERWAGESGLKFCQMTVILDSASAPTPDSISEFRQTAETKLAEASWEAPENSRSLCDCWSITGTIKASGPKGSFDADAVAVGGDFFAFHPLTLVSGGYLSADDLMKDRVVLDEKLAWMLFGSSQVAGMTAEIGGRECYIAGVISGETDWATQQSRSESPMVFLCYENRDSMDSSDGAVCYELVLPQPVENFAENLVKTAFPAANAIVRNTERFSFGGSMTQLKNITALGTRATPVVYPYWENAAVRVQTLCALLRGLALILLVAPGILAATELVRGGIALRRRLRGSGKRLWRRLQDGRDDAPAGIPEKTDEGVG